VTNGQRAVLVGVLTQAFRHEFMPRHAGECRCHARIERVAAEIVAGFAHMCLDGFHQPLALQRIILIAVTDCGRRGEPAGQQQRHQQENTAYHGGSSLSRFRLL
jgi:hypothetical protein